MYDADYHLTMTPGTIYPDVAPTSMNFRMLTYDLFKKHTFRNNNAGAEAQMEFYIITPRTAIPAESKSALGQPWRNAGPPPDSHYGAALYQPDILTNWNTTTSTFATPSGTPPAYTDGRTEPFTSTAMSQFDLRFTPYQIPMLSALYKIKRIRPKAILSVDGQWRKHPKGPTILKPGETCILVTKNGAVKTWYANKFVLPSTGLFSQAYAAYPGISKFLWVSLSGTLGHFSTSIEVATGYAQLDYQQSWKYKMCTYSQSVKRSVNIITNQPSTASIVRQVNPANHIEYQSIDNPASVSAATPLPRPAAPPAGQMDVDDSKSLEEKFNAVVLSESNPSSASNPPVEDSPDHQAASDSESDDDDEEDDYEDVDIPTGPQLHPLVTAYRELRTVGPPPKPN